MTKSKTKEFIIKSNLLLWYRKNKRNLPWRKLYKSKLPNPYYVMISEYMLQQTTVGTVKTRFQEFISKWPNIESLSKISNSTILSFWSGLGYYSRATNLLKAIKTIKKKYNGKIPSNYNDLLELPGIGVYTAKAILGIAYNRPVMPIDANIERIIARLYNFNSPIITIKEELNNKAKFFISKNSSTNLIQAFMDYGSIICKPKNPNCSICVIKKKCLSYKNNNQYNIPFKLKTKSKKLKKYSRAYVFLKGKNKILVRKRKSKGMLPSMLEVPNDVWVKNKEILVMDKIAHSFKDSLILKGSMTYSFSHFDLEVDVFTITVSKNKFNNHKWINKQNISKSGLPTIMKKIIELVFS